MYPNFNIILIFAVIICFFEACAQNSLKQSLIKKSENFYLLGLFFYVGVGYFLHLAYHKIPLGQINLVWSCFSIIIALIVGYLIYDEPMNKYTITAILFSFGAVYMSSLSNKHNK